LVVEVHGLLEAVDVELAEVIFRDHGKTDTLVALLLLLLLSRSYLSLLLRDLELRGVKVHELSLNVFLNWLRLRLHRRLLLLLRLLRRSRCGLGRLFLKLANVKSSRIGTDIVDEGCEGRVAKQSLKEATVALVLLQDTRVLAAQVGGFLSLEGNLAFELADVFYYMLA
jgi:hypothetical protein